MATIKRLKVTRWYLPNPDDRGKRVEVRAGTPGAVKVTELGKTYFIIWKEGGKTRREATGLTDKVAAQAYLGEWVKARERGQVGLVDPFKAHLDRPIIDHLNEYLATKKESDYKREIDRELRRVIAAKGLSVLRDMTAARLDDYLNAHPASVQTRRRFSRAGKTAR